MPFHEPDGANKPTQTPSPREGQARGAANQEANMDQQAAARKGDEGGIASTASQQAEPQTDRKQEFQSFDELFERKTYSINPTWITLLSACRVVPGTKDLQAFGSKINHNILLPEVMADITNNAIGNKARIFQTPVPKLDNDLPHMLLMNLVSRDKDIL